MSATRAHNDHPGQTLLLSPQGVQLALEAANAGIWEWHLATNHNLWTDEIWTLFGLDRTQHQPCFDNWLISVHPDDRALVQAAVLHASQLGQAFEIEWRSAPERGPLRWILSRGRPHSSPDAPGPIYTGIVMDITERKRAEQEVQQTNQHLEQRVAERTQALFESKRLLHHILDGVPGLVGYWTPELINLFANKAYSEWFGMSAQEIKGRHIKELLGPALFARNWHHLQAVLQGNPQCFERELPIPGRPGKYRISQAHYLPDVVDGQIKGFLVMVFDISDAKRAERQAEAASQAKSAFLASVSHELRTPLNAMFGLAQIGARDTVDPNTQETFEHILEAGQHLLALIDDVLDFSKIEAGKMSLQPEEFDMGQLLEHLMSMTHLRAESKGLTLRIDESAQLPRFLIADVTRLSQVILNLLSNAIKFSSHGQIKLALDYVHGHLRVDVFDQGVGIPAERRTQLFQPFEQVVERSAQGAGGTGLGLAISRRLVTLMGGTIDLIDSRLGAGSHFAMSVPLSCVHKHTDAPPLHVALTGLPLDEAMHFRRQLLLRGSDVTAINQLPRPQDGPIVLLVNDASMHKIDPAALAELVSGGCRVIRHCPGSVSQKRSGGPDLATATINGPLSPLRLLFALQQSHAKPEQVQTQRLKGIRVLAAEDNPVNRLVLEHMLSHEGAEVSFAFDGAQALEQVRQHSTSHFDIVLCDIQMPVMDGYQATEALRRIAPDLPVVGLTAHAFSAARQQAKEAGMVGYVTKPFMLDTLVDVVRRYARWRPRPAIARPDTPMAPAALTDSTPNHDGASDWQAMQAHYHGQSKLLARLVETLVGTLQDLLKELDAARNSHDIPAVAKLAHNIKGTALNLHTPELTRWAVLTQDQARAQHTDALLSAQALSECLDAFIAQLPKRSPTEQPEDDLINEAIRPEVAKNGRRNLLN